MIDGRRLVCRKHPWSPGRSRRRAQAWGSPRRRSLDPRGSPSIRSRARRHRGPRAGIRGRAPMTEVSACAQRDSRQQAILGSNHLRARKSRPGSEVEMRLLGPDVQKLMAAEDVAGLACRLALPRQGGARDAARALGWIELPPSATERHYHQYRWFGNRLGTRTAGQAAPDGRRAAGDRSPGGGGGSGGLLAGGELSKLLVEAAVEATGRIGGAAGVEAVIRSIAELEGHPGIWSFDKYEYLCRLGVEGLIGILNDEARPRDLRATVCTALHFGPRVLSWKFNTRFSTWTLRRPRGQGRRWRNGAHGRTNGWRERRRSRRRRRSRPPPPGRNAGSGSSLPPSPPHRKRRRSWPGSTIAAPTRGVDSSKWKRPPGRFRDVGRHLDEYGGFPLMRDAHAQFLRPATGHGAQPGDGLGRHRRLGRLRAPARRPVASRSAGGKARRTVGSCSPRCRRRRPGDGGRRSFRGIAAPPWACRWIDHGGRPVPSSPGGRRPIG